MGYLLSKIKKLAGLNVLSGGKVLAPDQDVLVQKGNLMHELILLLCFSYSLVFSILNYVLGNGLLQTMITCLPMIVVPIEYVLYRKGYPLLSKTMNMILITTVVGLLSLVTTPMTGILSYFIPCFLGAMITFQGREQAYAYLLTLISVLYLFFFVITDIRLGDQAPISHQQMHVEWILNYGGASLATIFQVGFILIISNKLQQNLVSTTEQLEGKNMELTKLSLIAKKAKNGVVISDHHGCIEWVNDAFTEMSGYTLEEVIGKKPKEFLQKPGDRSMAQDLLTEKLQKKEFVHTTIVNYKKDGTPYYNQLEIIPVFDDHHVHTNFISIQKDITEQLRLEKTILDQKLNEQKLITEITIQSQEKEKSELGAELHDNINQILAAAKMYLDLYAAKLQTPDSAIQKSHYNIDLALQEIRKLSHSLVTPTLGNRDLFDAIKDLVTDLTQAAGIEIIYHNDLKAGTEISDTRKLVLYRIVQEHINNILKYAKASRVIIRLSTIENKILLTMEDNGIGFDPGKKSRGIGFKNILNRVQLYSGDMRVETEPGKGCKLEAFIHLN